MKYCQLSLLLVFLLACSNNPYKSTNKSYRKQVKILAKSLVKTPLTDSANYPEADFWAGTTNFNLRKPNIVVIHHTAQQSCEQTLKTFTLPRTKVSAHYVICKNGTVHQMLNDYLRAWHAGTGAWGNINDVNSASIGIELDNDGSTPFAEPQMTSLIALLAKLKKVHGIPAANFIGHADLAPRRKNDPSVWFDWKKLADNGFGLWYSDTAKIKIPVGFNAIQAFRMLGYDTRDSAAVIATFKRKFTKTDKVKTLNEGDKKILLSLLDQGFK
jgi:N-acetylmuramoyl-L-alanine amidase